MKGLERQLSRWWRLAQVPRMLDSTQRTMLPLLLVIILVPPVIHRRQRMHSIYRGPSVGEALFEALYVN